MPRTFVQKPPRDPEVVLVNASIRDAFADCIMPYALAPAAANKVISGTFTYYANLDTDARTVNVADAVLVITNEYTSIDDAFPADGAVPPSHLGVTVVPSI